VGGVQADPRRDRQAPGARSHGRASGDRLRTFGVGAGAPSVIDPFRSIEQLSADLERGTVSALAFTEAMLARIATHDEVLGAFAHVAADARAQAEKADRDIRAGRRLG